MENLAGTIGENWLFMLLGLVALGLTGFMFHTRNAMLGFPSAVFWALFGGFAYTLSAATWDIHFMIAFASLLGMVTFTALGAYGLRERRDTIADEEMERGEGGYIDESKKSSQEKREKDWYEDDGIPDTVGESRPRERARQRRQVSSKRKGEFDF